MRRFKNDFRLEINRQIHFVHIDHVVISQRKTFIGIALYSTRLTSLLQDGVRPPIV